MRTLCFAVAVLLACACSKVDGGAAAAGTGCISSTSWANAARTLDLGVNDFATDGAGSLQLAQSFLVPGAAGSTLSVTSVSLPLYASGTFAGLGTTTLTLRQDNGGVPGNILSNSKVILLSSTSITSSTPTLVTFSLDQAISLATGTAFWIVLDASYGETTTPVVKWAADDGNFSSSAYTNGKAEYESDTTPGPAHAFSTGAFGSLRELGFQIDCAS